MQSPKVLANQIRGTRPVSRGEASASPAIQQLIAEALENIDSRLAEMLKRLTVLEQPMAAVEMVTGVEDVLIVTDADLGIYTATQSAERMTIFKNGMKQEENVDYTRAGAVVTFKPDAIPNSTDRITAIIW